MARVTQYTLMCAEMMQLVSTIHKSLNAEDGEGEGSGRRAGIVSTLDRFVEEM